MDSTDFAKILASINSRMNQSFLGYNPFSRYAGGYTDTDYACCCCSGDPQPSNIIEGTCKDVTEEEE